MPFRTRATLAVGCAAVVALSIPAFSRPSPRGLEPDQRATLRTSPSRPVAQHAAKPKPAHVAARPAPVAAAQRPVQQASLMQRMSQSLFGKEDLVAEARKYMGTNPTARSKLWCATFMNMVLRKVGYAGTNSDAAKSFAYYGRRISEPQVGAIAVLTRGKKGGHVGVVSGVDPQGNPIIISGNHNKRVGEATYPRTRVIAYVMPSEAPVSTIQIAARSVPNTATDAGLSSPIAELLAAIEAEQSHAETRPQARATETHAPEPQPVPRAAALAQPQPIQRVAPQPQAPQRLVQQMPPQAVPQRIVQQMPEPPRPAPQAVRRGPSIDPRLADFLGIERPRPRPLPIPQQQQQQRAGQIAVATPTAR